MSNSTQKTNKKSTSSSNNSPSSIGTKGQGSITGAMLLSTDELSVESRDQTQLMNQINGAVRANDFSPQLASQIFSLYQHLKSNGQKLEETHKADLNKVFVSLRQACCRDNGQLGTPCRLKIMELIELRAMGWKTNLSHTQYYLDKADKLSLNGSPDPNIQGTQTLSSNTQSSSKSSVQTAVSQQKSTHQPVYNFNQPQPPFYLPAEIAANPQHPGYFLIPTGAWTPQMIPTGMLPSPQFGNPRQHPPQDWLARNAAIAAVSAHFKIPPTIMSQSAYVPAAPTNSKSSKQPQFREEITIRNADSGKIMGVKGRRVAAVEQISNTVISFQKVDANSRYRTLAITGNNEESIMHAKTLIAETIKRNVSPNRIDMNGSESIQSNVPVGKVIGEDLESAEKKKTEDAEETEDEEPEISIETNTDGTLKLTCADPEMLQAAQQALKTYLNLRTNRMTSQERQQAKERRKSMPLQSSSVANTKPIDNIQEKPKQDEKEINDSQTGMLNKTSKMLTGSTPNLLADSAEEEKSPPLRYEREKMLSLREQVQSQLRMWPTAITDDQLPYVTKEDEENKS